MPKEVICKPPSHPNDPGDPFCTKVGWNADFGDVSVATVGREGRSLFWLLLGGGMPPGTTKEAHDEYREHHLARFGELVLGIVRQHPLPTESQTVAGTPWEPATLAATLLDAMDTSYDYDGIYAHFDRTQVNQLIRALRRARDAAFGEDA